MIRTALSARPLANIANNEFLANLLSQNLFDLFKEEEGLRDQIFFHQRRIKHSLQHCMFLLTSNDVENGRKCLAEADQSLAHLNASLANNSRLNRLGESVEDLVTLKAFVHFITNRQLIPFSEAQPCTAEEFLGGIASFCQTLSALAMKSMDIDLSLTCLQLTRQLQTEYMKFDFRNSTLRRSNLFPILA